MKQYFEENDNLIDDEKIINFNFNGNNLVFKTNTGLFSKDAIDDYSIKMLEQVDDENINSILDLGCGYGFIGIALSKKYPKAKIDFIDINKRACEYTNKNAKLNNLDNYKVINSDGIVSDDKYDLILLNPPIHAGKQNVYKLYHQAYDHLNQFGSFYIVIYKKHGAKSTIDYLYDNVNKLEIKFKKKGLYVIKITK